MTALAENGTQLKAIEIRGVDPQREQAVSRLSQFITGKPGNILILVNSR